MSFYEEAITKLNEGLKNKMERYAEAMKRSVHDALAEFCRQDEEFAQAVANGGSFTDCMKAVAGCVKGNSLSDMEAWGAAVRFYFPGAGIKCELRINLCAEVEDEAGRISAAAQRPRNYRKTAGPVIDLSDYF